MDTAAPSPTTVEPSQDRSARRARLPWPLPALLSWCACWACFALLQRALVDWGGAASAAAAVLATALGVALGLHQSSRWRRLIVAGGFPLSLLAVGSLPALTWLGVAALLVCLYPTGTWRDAPWYPTGRRALSGLATHVPLLAGARVLDAGCGLGDGLAALRREYPQARLAGTEWSAALSALARLRCPWADIRRGDLWADDWSTCDLVYLFQRPESMPRAWAKARTEMRPGSWLVSLAFEAPGATPVAVLRADSDRPVWIYRMGRIGASTPSPAMLKSCEVAADMQNNNSGARRRRRSRHTG